ncbi:hypothetical protein TNCV_2800641 [Trichonephila clavipes]|nr:hypothetical protein TNCV_2800641 [Trichonephila clavipes]
MSIHIDAKFATKLCFACQQIGSKIERYTNTNIADIHLTCGTFDCKERVGNQKINFYNTFFVRLHLRLPNNRSRIVENINKSEK